MNQYIILQSNISLITKALCGCRKILFLRSRSPPVPKQLWILFKTCGAVRRQVFSFSLPPPLYFFLCSILMGIMGEMNFWSVSQLTWLVGLSFWLHFRIQHFFVTFLLLGSQKWILVNLPIVLMDFWRARNDPVILLRSTSSFLTKHCCLSPPCCDQYLGLVPWCF